MSWRAPILGRIALALGRLAWTVVTLAAIVILPIASLFKGRGDKGEGGAS